MKIKSNFYLAISDSTQLRLIALLETLIVFSNTDSGPLYVSLHAFSVLDLRTNEAAKLSNKA